MDTLHRDYWPTHGWRTGTPDAVAIDADALARAHAYAQKSQRIQSLLVVRAGLLVFEQYYLGCDEKQYCNQFSATKSVISALVGIVLRKGYLQSLDQPLLDFFPEYREAAIDDPHKQITLRHLLTMSSGYQLLDGNFRMETYLQNIASLERMLRQPLAYPPGEVFQYDTTSVQLLSYILVRVTGERVAAFAQRELFGPLGIWQTAEGHSQPWKTESGTRIDPPHWFFDWEEGNDFLWSVDQSGVHTSTAGLQLTPREMAKFGYLYLNRGVWDGQQILPAHYVQDSTRSFVEGADYGYGYLWWLSSFQDHQIYSALGYGGQAIAVAPDLDLVVVVTSEPRDLEDLSQPLLHDFILPGVK